MAAHIVLRDLTKSFSTPIKNPAHSAWKNFFHPDVSVTHAVDHVNLTVERGERVAFIGPNGAGKSTTIKMMTGILRPTSGTIRVAGLDPKADRQKLAFRIGTLFGQRSQLVANLPVLDSFELFGAMYELSSTMIRRRAKELTAAFDLEEFMHRPVRKLSLGQRMRAEIAVSLLHKPEIVFLDEPTIGLDVVAKRALRDVLNTMCEKEGVTLFLTSHDAGDIEALCDRTIIVNHGKIIIDEQTDALRQRHFTVKHLHVELATKVNHFSFPFASHVVKDGTHVSLSINTDRFDLNDAITEILRAQQVVDLDVSNPSLEEIIASVYAAQR